MQLVGKFVYHPCTSQQNNGDSWIVWASPVLRWVLLCTYMQRHNGPLVVIVKLGDRKSVV